MESSNPKHKLFTLTRYIVVVLLVTITTIPQLDQTNYIYIVVLATLLLAEEVLVFLIEAAGSLEAQIGLSVRTVDLQIHSVRVVPSRRKISCRRHIEHWARFYKK